MWYSVAMSGDEKMVSGSADRTVRVWDVETGKCLEVNRAQGVEGHTDYTVKGHTVGGGVERTGMVTRRCACGTWARGTRMFAGDGERGKDPGGALL